MTNEERLNDLEEQVRQISAKFQNQDHNLETIQKALAGIREMLEGKASQADLFVVRESILVVEKCVRDLQKLMGTKADRKDVMDLRNQVWALVGIAISTLVAVIMMLVK